jgi:hypothetical protein
VEKGIKFLNFSINNANDERTGKAAHNSSPQNATSRTRKSIDYALNGARTYPSKGRIMYGKNNNLRVFLEPFKWTGNAFTVLLEKYACNNEEEVGIMESLEWY